jgi:hypothetical protein
MPDVVAPGPAPEPERPPRRKRVERYVRIYGRGMFFFIPLTLQLIALLAVGVSQFAAIHFTTAQASTVAVAAALSFVVTAGFIQALGYLSPIYIESGKHMLAETVAWTVIGIGAAVATVIGLIALGVVALTGAYPSHDLHVLAAYYFLLSANALASALLYMLRKFVWMVLITIVGLIVTALFYKHTSIKIYRVHWIGLSVVVGLQLLVGLLVLHRRAANTKGDMRLAKLPRARLLAKRALPFGVYGFFYFSFLTTDRVVAWASGTHKLPLWFQTPYELGLDWALGAVVFSLAFLEITVENFSAMLVPTAERYAVNAVREFNRAISRFWARQLAFVGAIAAFGSVMAIAVAYGLHELDLLGPAEKVYDDPVSHYVFGFGICAYAFLALGIANSVFVLSLNRPWRAIASILPGLLTSIVIGTVLTSHMRYWTAVVGMFAGSIVFACVSAWQAWRTLKRADYFNYSAW